VIWRAFWLQVAVFLGRGAGKGLLLRGLTGKYEVADDTTTANKSVAAGEVLYENDDTGLPPPPFPCLDPVAGLHMNSAPVLSILKHPPPLFPPCTLPKPPARLHICMYHWLAA